MSIETGVTPIQVPRADAAVEARGNQPLPVHDPASAWIVESGAVDLFHVAVAGVGAPAGPRRHVLRASAGEVIFGFPDLRESMNCELLMVGSPGTQMLRVDLARLQETGPGGELSASGAALLEKWIAGISEAVAPEVSPQDYLRLEPGGKVRLSQGKNALCLHGAVWVRHAKGSSQFLGVPGLPPVGGSLFFPLTPRTWLTAGSDSMLEVFDTAAMQRADPHWECLTAFHRIIIALLMVQEVEDEQHEGERLRLKKQSDARQMRAALGRLAAPLNPQRGLELPERDADPLVAACQIVGSSIGLELRPPPPMARVVVSKDPIRDIARASNVRVRQVLLRGAWWRDDHGPLLGSWQDTKKPVALVPRKQGGYELVDPVDGSTRKVKAELAAALDPYANVFYRPFPNKKLDHWELLKFGLEGCERDLRLVLLAGIASGLLGLVIPLFTGMLFDTIIPGAQRSQLLQITVLLVLGAIATAIFDLTRSLTLLRVEGKMGASLQAAVWDRLMSLPVAFFRHYNAGDLADRANGIDGIRAALTGTVTNSIISGIFSTLNLTLMFYYSWKLSLVAIGLVTIGVAATLCLGLMQVRRYRVLARIAGWLSGQVLQFISGVAKFRVSGTETRAFAVWSRGYSRQKLASILTRSTANQFTVFNSFFFVFGPMALFYAVDQWQGDIGAGRFLAFNAAFGAMFMAVMQLAGAVLQVMSLFPVYERATPILLSEPEVDSAKANPGELAGNIEISHVIFRYDPEGPVVLDDVSVRIEAGQFVALVGPSGCGKSTLFRMLLGFEKPEVGAVYFDGQDLQGLDLALVRRQMGVVLQNSTLFRGDIFANIVGSKPLTLDDAWEAARMAGMEKDIKDLPMGMHTIIGEGGGGLSGGQRQRLMIARAIVSKPRILLFDEATSALDNQTQAIVSRSLEGLKSTRVVIAHRLSTVVNADRIFVLDQGRIVQSGSYAELIGQEGLFAQLAKRQLT
jgi:NHLM bacteriocin system ABC transporter ATP-binding protein